MSGIFYASPFLAVSSSIETTSRIADRILSFARLSDGWRYGEGRGATDSSVSIALHVLSTFNDHGVNENDIEVFPDVEGGILVSGYHGQESLEVFCRPDGRIDLSRENEDEIVYELHDASTDTLRVCVRNLWQTSTKLSVFFTQNISAEESDVSKALHSRIPQITGESPSSIHSVRGSAVEPNVHMYPVFTSPTYRENRQSFGG